ncbi:MAG: chitin disaccharide deacetylase [Firmicutes bacterium]|nr:chitin disaccharide deacetylase [Bacillota bacterium]
MQLIVNADDFGYSPGQNFGIIDAFENGIVRSTTLLANAPAALQALELAKPRPELGIGIHLVIDMGKPLSPPNTVPSLINKDGSFRKPPFNTTLDFDIKEVEREWRAQIMFLIDRGFTPTHLDGHHHFHYHPQLLPISCKLAREFQLPIRSVPPQYDRGPYTEVYSAELPTVKHPDYCLTDFYDTGVSEEYFLNFFTNYPQLKDKTVEIMSHAAWLDDVILTGSSYNLPRVKELQVLKSPAVREWVQQNQVELINFSHL